MNQTARHEFGMWVLAGRQHNMARRVYARAAAIWRRRGNMSLWSECMRLAGEHKRKAQAALDTARAILNQ